MTEYAGFTQGGVTFPLPNTDQGIGGSGSTFLRDADPTLFYMLEFYSAVINKHAGARFLEEAALVGASQIELAVADTLPINPEAYLTATYIRFPLLSGCRKRSKFKYYGQRRHSVDELEFAYVLPAMSPAEAERLMPMLRSVTAIVDNRTELGADPDYTPTGAAPGSSVWDATGITRAEVMSVEYGGYAPAKDLFYPAVMLKVEIQERSDYKMSEFVTLDSTGASVTTVDSEVLDTVENDLT